MRRRPLSTAAVATLAAALAGLAVACPCLVASPPAAAAGQAGRVDIQTVPALGGVRLSVGGAVVTTLPGGTVSLQVPELNGIASRVSLADDRLDPLDTVAISKVVPAAHSTAHESRLEVGLDVTSLVALNVDPGTTGIPPQSVRGLRLHSLTGQIVTVDPYTTREVDLLSRMTRVSGGTLTTQTVTWSVDSVTAAPGVSAGAHRPAFDPFSHPTWTVQLHPVSGTVIADTLPATPGVQLSLAGQTITTGTTGEGLGPVADLNNVAGRLTLATTDAGPFHVSIQRVVQQRAGTHVRRVLVLLELRRSVQLDFTDAAGRVVPASSLEQVALASGAITVDLAGASIGQPVWLLVGTATQSGSGWQARQLSYTASLVRVHGSNAVFPGKQKFDPNRGANWPISLALFDLTVTVHDALFGNALHSTLRISRPDGTRFVVRTGSGQLLGLVRGNYSLEVPSAAIGSRTQVLVSRSSRVDLRVLTRLDLALVAVAGAALAGAAIWLGTWLPQARRRRRKSLLR